MPENNDASDNQTKGQESAPAGLPESEVAPDCNAYPQPASAEAEPGQTDKPPTYKTLWKEIRIIDLINSVVGVSMLLVAIAAYRVASDTRDIKRAVSNLSDLAVQTKRQADGQAEQLKLLKVQNGTFAGQLEQARQQTKAIAEQTVAIKSSSDANVRSANAQRQMADVTASVSKPRPEIHTVALTNLSAAPDKDGFIPVNIGLTINNAGGGVFVAEYVEFGIFAGKKLPPTMPAFQGTMQGEGNSIGSPLTSAFAANGTVKILRAAVERGSTGEAALFFYGVLHYRDAANVGHRVCFGRQFRQYGADPTVAIESIPAGGSAYHCNT